MSPNTSVISARVLHPICNSTNTVPFVILRKTGNLDIDNWIFGSKLFQTIPQCSFDSVAEIHINPDLNKFMTSEDLNIFLQKSLNQMELSKTLQNQAHSTLMLNPKIIPFMSSVSCMFNPFEISADDTKEHHKRLIDALNLWGFKILPVDGDGNCCFSAIAYSLLLKKKNNTFSRCNPE